MTWFWFPRAMSGPNVQSHDFGNESGNAQDRMDIPKLYKECKIFRFWTSES